MSNEPEMVTVRIHATERVHYEKEVQMPRAEFERLDSELDDAGVDEEPAERIIDRYINRSADWLDYGDYEIDTFETVEPAAE